MAIAVETVEKQEPQEGWGTTAGVPELPAARLQEQQPRVCLGYGT